MEVEVIKDSTYTIEYRIQLQKEIARKIIDKLVCFDGGVILAGGAPRNWYFGWLAKDLDFYLRVKDIPLLRQEMENLGFQEEISFKPSVDYQKEEIEAVFNFRKDDTTVQLISLEDTIFPAKVLHNFDYDLCKIYYDGFWREERWHQFNDDVENKRITFNSSSSKLEKKNAAKRFERMTQLFPDFKFRIV